METKNLGLIPIRNFAKVDSGLYRSAQPQYNYEWDWLKNHLNLNKIINLRKESSLDDLHASKRDILHERIDVIDHKEPTVEQAVHFMNIIKENQSKKQNLLFHCAHGHGRTSTFCVLARLALGWSLDEALQEEKEVFHYQFKYPVQIEWLRTNFK